MSDSLTDGMGNLMQRVVLLEKDADHVRNYSREHPSAECHWTSSS